MWGCAGGGLAGAGVQEAREGSLLARLGVNSQHPGAGEADGQAALGFWAPGGRSANSVQVGRRLPRPEWGWPLTHPRRSPPPRRDALCLGSLASSGSDPVLLIQQAQVQPQLGKIPQATWHGQKKLKKERKRNACCLHSPSLSMRQPAPSPRNVVGAVGAHQTWSCPTGSPSVKLPLTVPQKSGAVEQRSLLLVLWLQVTRCDPVPTQGGEEAVQTGFWGAVGSEPNGRQLPPSILTRALWGGSQARGPTGRNTPCVPALSRQGRGSLDPRPVLLQWHPGGTGKKGSGKGQHRAGRGHSCAPAEPLCPSLVAAVEWDPPLPTSRPSAPSLPRAPSCLFHCGLPPRPASSEAQLLPGRFPS